MLGRSLKAEERRSNGEHEREGAGVGADIVVDAEGNANDGVRGHRDGGDVEVVDGCVRYDFCDCKGTRSHQSGRGTQTTTSVLVEIGRAHV